MIGRCRVRRVGSSLAAALGRGRAQRSCWGAEAGGRATADEGRDLAARQSAPTASHRPARRRMRTSGGSLEARSLRPARPCLPPRTHSISRGIDPSRRQQRARPDVGRELYSGSRRGATQVFGPIDPVGAHVDRRVPEGARQELPGRRPIGHSHWRSAPGSSTATARQHRTRRRGRHGRMVSSGDRLMNTGSTPSIATWQSSSAWVRSYWPRQSTVGYLLIDG